MKKRIFVSLTAIILSVALSACGSSSKSESYDSAAMEEAPMEEYYEAELNSYAEDGFVAEEGADTGVTQSNTVENNRKMIKTVHLGVETKDYDGLLLNVENQIKELGGYIESLECYGNSYRSASITARIPAEKLDGFVKQIGDSANVTSRSEFVEDVTLQYVDLDSHARMLEEEQERLLELLETAYSIEDMITIESRLGEIRYQLESMKSQLRTFDNQVTYSTVHINIDEVIELTPVVELSDGERIAQGFSKSVADVFHGIKEFVIDFIIHIPYIIVFAVVVLIILLLVRVFMKLADKYSARIAKERANRVSITKNNGPYYVRKPESSSVKKTDTDNKSETTE